MAVRTTIRTPMPAKMRAKQFAMFDALKGLTEAISVKERTCDQKRELTQDKIEEINYKLNDLRVGDYATIFYYCKGIKASKKTAGVIKRVNVFQNKLQIGDEIIDFHEIEDVSCECC